jgi:hypothetical protein
LTGETQLRAKRTRIKILRAIADKNGIAGFSDIKVTTGLSTGSIYYHLERMGSYVTKDARHYAITEEGLRLLRESDAKYAKRPQQHGAEEKLREHPGEEQRDSQGAHEEPPRTDFSKFRRVAVVGGLILVGTLGIVYFGDLSRTVPFYLSGNVNAIVFLSLATALGAVISYKSRVIFSHVGYRGLLLPVLSAAAIFSGIVFLSGASFTGAAGPQYDNSMDALLSSYSLHWQVR